MRIRRVLRLWPALVVVAAVVLVWALWPARNTFTVSPETTFVTGPLDANGFVDFPAALNDRMAKEVTPENNANVLIWQALGPHPEGGTMPPEFFRRLGIPSPPEKGEYFVGWDKYFKTNVEHQDDEPDSKEQWNNRTERARKWPWKQADEPEIAAWLKANEKPLALLVEAGKRPQYYNPLVSRSTDPRSARLIGSLLPSVQKCRESANALTCRAMAKMGQGDFDGAWQDLLACQRLGRLLARGATLIEHLVGVAIVAIATNGQITFLGHGTHSSKKIMVYLADLSALPPMPPPADKMAVTERLLTLDALVSVACNGPHAIDQLTGTGSPAPVKNELLNRMLSRSIDFDPAFRNANQMFDRCDAAMRIPDRANRKVAFDQIATDLKQRKAAATETTLLERAAMGRSRRGEYIGDILIGLLFPAIEKMQDAADRSEQTQANLQIAFALAAYRADTGRYPARLDDLAPKYLPTIPGDLFSGKPLIYRPTEKGYLLYSVGVNGLDEDGRNTEDQPKGDDLRVRMPVEEPKAK